MKQNRRQFIRSGTLVSAAFFQPKFLKVFEKRSTGHKILVIVELSGGNDALNTIIPYRNDIYYRARPHLAIKRKEVLPLTDEWALHPALHGLKTLYDKCALAVLNNVGFPGPEYSHFAALNTWQTAAFHQKNQYTGWIGRYLDTERNAPVAIEVSNTLSLALKGKEKRGLALTDPSQLFSESIKRYTSHANYPDTEFGKKLKTIAELILSGCDASVYYVSLSGFDTHIDQKPVQQRLFSQLGNGLKAFSDELIKNNHFQDIMVMTFSEFGRQIRENGLGGTDHGAAGSMFLLSGRLKKQGMLNTFPVPDPWNGQENELKYQIDFRDVYATLLRKWLQANDHAVLGSDHPYLDFV